MGLLSAMVGWKGYAAAGGVAAVLGGLAVYQVTTWRADARYSDMVATHATIMQAYADRATTAESAQREEEGRRDTARQGIENDTRKEIQSAKDAARAAATERDRMRANLGAFVAAQRRAAGANPAADAGRSSQPGADPLDLLTGLLQRHSDELVAVGGYADDLKARGESCARKYDSLTQK